MIQSAGLYALVTWAGLDTRIAPLVAAVVAIPFTYLLSRKILVPGAAAQTENSSRPQRVRGLSPPSETPERPLGGTP